MYGNSPAWIEQDIKLWHGVDFIKYGKFVEILSNDVLSRLPYREQFKRNVFIFIIHITEFTYTFIWK